MALVSIELSDDRMLIAAARTVNGQSQLIATDDIRLQPNSTTEQTAALLTTFVNSHNCGKSDAIVIVQRGDGEIRELTVPPAPDDELPDMVRFAARAQFASMNDNWLFDYVPLTTDSTQPQTMMACAIAPQVADLAREITDAAGLKLKQITLRPWATMTALHRRVNDDKIRLVINPAGNNVDLTIARGTKILTTRTVKVSEESEPRTRQLLGEVRRTLAASKRSLDGLPVTETIVCDDERSNRHLQGDLTRRLEIPVSFFDPLKDLPLSMPANTPPVDDAHRLIPAVGMLIPNVDTGATGLNFLDPRRPKVTTSNRERWVTYAAVAGLAALICIIIGWWTLSSQSRTIRELTAELDDAVMQNQGDAMRPSVDQTLSVTRSIDNWKKQDINWLNELQQLSQRAMTADDVMITNLDMATRRDEASMTVDGAAADVKREAELIDQLSDRPYRVRPTNSGNSDLSDYELTFNYQLELVPPDNLVGEMDQAAITFQATKTKTDIPAP